MQLHQLKPRYKKKEKKRVGRGGKKGTYSGRGMKGQKARAGAKLKPAIRVFIKRYHKLRGYRFKGKEKEVAIINIKDLERNFEAKQKINPEILLKKRLVRKIKGKVPQVKILSEGEITKALTIENCGLSKTAKEKIKKAGGIIHEVK